MHDSRQASVHDAVRVCMLHLIAQARRVIGTKSNERGRPDQRTKMRHM